MKVQLRVPDAVTNAVIAALDPPAEADLTVTDKRPATTADGEVLALTHCALRLDGADEDKLAAVLAGVARVLAVCPTLVHATFVSRSRPVGSAAGREDRSPELSERGDAGVLLEANAAVRHGERHPPERWDDGRRMEGPTFP